MPQIANYSYAYNLGQTVTPIETMLGGSNTGNPGLGGLSGPGGINTTYSFASSTCTSPYVPATAINTFGNQLSTPYATTFSTDGCSYSTNLASWIWLHFTLDDSQTFAFPDSVPSGNTSNHSALSGLTVYYHPSSGYRLRGGATFNNQVLQSLDAPP